LNSCKWSIDSNSIVGDNLVWKNAQKNDTKIRISETMKRIIPHRRSFVTIFVCNAWYGPSPGDVSTSLDYGQ